MLKMLANHFMHLAVTASKEGPGPVIDGTAIGTADNPLKPGATGGDANICCIRGW